ncbi:xanthine dehydrogenase accessory protein XdhC [Roseibium denhamense]|uniref:Molybdenum cofactor sulfurylase n=1 Tax=Roseibium denhamense TaxID=76305 RepID=A0ABY1NPV6_9HYPH|nr:xanthine dehydrogenase accessory protein XdhC [Roseibium denhamense]MTI07956.1 xanthine dehydrogenase accessory protein XdhC [Roseibium denhamense]SMP15175.1 molybdenum cofactor sulfurylase [Roseibium denhamense]
MKVWGHIADVLKTSEACALVTIISADGSTPRDAGTRMVVREDGGFFGTIGGGTLEFEAIRNASNAARTAKRSFSLETVSLGPDLGQCCGGRTKVAIEVLNAEDRQTVDHLASLERQQSVFSTKASVENNELTARQVIEKEHNSSAKLVKNSSGNVLVETFGEHRRALYLFGAGHVGRALVLALAPLPFDITWVDSRADQFPGAVPFNVQKVCLPDPAEVLQGAPSGAFVLAMTHSHALDEHIMARALLAQRFEYCGVIGSKTKRARFQKRLKAQGVSERLISRMVCPVGVTAIKSKHPAAIAAGIAVDLLERDEASHQQAAAGEGLAQKRTHGQ